MSVQSIINEAAKYENHNEIKSTSQARDLAPAGKTVCRFIEYIELGVQPQRPYMGVEKKPVEMVKLTFELLGPKNIHEVTGEDGKVTKFADRLYMTKPKLRNTKARFYKLWTKLKYGREDLSHIGQLLGEAFTVEISHVKGKTARPDGSFPEWIDARKDGEYTFDAPFLEDPITGTVTKLNVPEALSPLKAFVWDCPDHESWASLFIEGTYQKKFSPMRASTNAPIAGFGTAWT